MLTTAQAAEFGNLFVSPFADVAHDTHLKDEAIRLYLEESSLVEKIFTDLGPSFVPHMKVCNTSADIPFDIKGNGPVRLNSQTAEIFIAPTEDNAGQALHALLNEYLAHKANPDALEQETGHIRISPMEYVPCPKNRGGDVTNLGFGLHASRSIYDPADGPDPDKQWKNTKADIYFFRGISEAERKFWIEYTFSHADQFTPQAFLRNLRVVNGTSHADMALRLGITEIPYQKYESESEKIGSHRIPLKSCIKIIEENYFRLPCQSYIDRSGEKREIVDPHYSRFFVEKLGYPEAVHSKPMQDQLWSVLHAQHDAVREGKLSWSQLPSIRAVTRTLLRGKVDGLRGKKVHHLYNDPKEGERLSDALSGPSKEKLIYEALPQFATRMEADAMQQYWLKRLPYRSARGSLHPSPYSAPTAEECTVIIKGRGHSIGQFLRWYREETGKPQAEIAQSANVSMRTVRFWEQAERLPADSLERIIANNAYALPTDKDARVDPQLAAALRVTNKTELDVEQILRNIRDKATNSAEYIKLYREATGRSRPLVARKVHRSVKGIQHIEQGSRLPPTTLDDLLTSNAYGFPTDEGGAIRQDILADLGRLNTTTPAQAVAEASAHTHHLGAFLKHYREATEQLQETVAQKAGISERTVGNWEASATLRPSTLEHIIASNAYGLPPDPQGKVIRDIAAHLEHINNWASTPNPEVHLMHARTHTAHTGEYLRRYRESMKLTQRDIAAQAGKGEKKIREWEQAESIPYDILDHLLHTNAYHFPVNSNATVRADVVQDLYWLNHKCAQSWAEKEKTRRAGLMRREEELM